MMIETNTDGLQPDADCKGIYELDYNNGPVTRDAKGVQRGR